MIGKVIMIIAAVLLSVHILNILINLWLRRRKYAVVQTEGYEDLEEYYHWGVKHEEK